MKYFLGCPANGGVWLCDLIFSVVFFFFFFPQSCHKVHNLSQLHQHFEECSSFFHFSVSFIKKWSQCLGLTPPYINAVTHYTPERCI